MKRKKVIVLLLFVPTTAVAAECSLDWGTTIVYLPKAAESPEVVKLFLEKGARVVTETAARTEMEQLKKESYKTCKDDRCQIELGQAVSASHMVQKAEAMTLYVWDLKSEAIVCTLTLPSSKTSSEKKGLTPRQIIDGTLLAKGMTVENVLQLAGEPDGKSDFSGTFALKYNKNNICKKNYNGTPGSCRLHFDKDGLLDSCRGVAFGICPFAITQN